MDTTTAQRPKKPRHELGITVIEMFTLAMLRATTVFGGTTILATCARWPP
jgi:hypothetical protein